MLLCTTTCPQQVFQFSLSQTPQGHNSKNATFGNHHHIQWDLGLWQNSVLSRFNHIKQPEADFHVPIGKLPEGSSKINRLSLNRCPPYTEIFSKRRKIYSVCVESLSMPLHLTQK